ncbi:hypothetical protein WB60_01390 [bacteria symbiont BFo2 of Frankliniella occidentalis]|nr:hypothetical protein WB60_01390 [bacteria symbiont BFo2 of Frankliniella occidentalis]
MVEGTLVIISFVIQPLFYLYYIISLLSPPLQPSMVVFWLRLSVSLCILSFLPHFLSLFATDHSAL